MMGIRGKKKEEEEPARRGSRRRSKKNNSVEEGKGVAASESVEEGKTSEEPEITMDVCEDWLNESHTLLRNMLVRFNEGLTPLELDALANGLKCVELVLKDEDMMVMYHSDAIDMAEEAKKAEAKEKRKQ